MQRRGQGLGKIRQQVVPVRGHFVRTEQKLKGLMHEGWVEMGIILPKFLEPRKPR
jgi:hypothetical protein